MPNDRRTVLAARDGAPPREGLVPMSRADVLFAALFAVAAFVVCALWLRYPVEKVFDEVYYPRAAAEYLAHADVGGHGPFEYTHPPLTKLIVALSILLFGGLPAGDTTLGWRFLNVVIGAMMLPLAYAFVKRITGSTLGASLAAALLLFDGFRFVQSRIATPEITVAVLALAVLYAFYRWWSANDGHADVARERGNGEYPGRFVTVLGAGALVAALAAWFVPLLGTRHVGPEWTAPARIVAFAYLAAVAYLAAWFVAERDAPPVSIDGTARRPFAPGLWLVVLGLACGLLMASKWNGILDLLVVIGLTAFVVVQRFLEGPALYGNPFRFRLDVLVAWLVTVTGAVYLLSYLPYFALGHNLVDLVEMQHAMYDYHHSLVATHPYASPWWQWPLLLRPTSYYYGAFAPYAVSHSATDCCVAEIIAIPNPLVWWTGLISVPFVGFLAWKERSRGFLLLAVAYVMQWLPWALSPRIAFAYHFFPNLAIIAMCDAILLHRVWCLRAADGNALWPRTAVIAYVLAAALIFVFFYPVLAGTHIPWDQWRARMWLYPQWV
jgi:dolichyl-phosphate-mannose-protein mannosyltransferase